MNMLKAIVRDRIAAKLEIDPAADYTTAALAALDAWEPDPAIRALFDRQALGEEIDVSEWREAAGKAYEAGRNMAGAFAMTEWGSPGYFDSLLHLVEDAG